MPKSSILVVEDNQGEREFIAEAMRIENYDVEDAGNCAEAREKLHNKKFDIILLDLILPDTVDLDFLREILDEYSDSFIIIITAVEDSSISARALKAGVYDYITKPFTVEELNIAVMRALEQRKLLAKSQLKEEVVDSIRKLVDVIEAKDHYIESHAAGVALLAMKIATAMGMDEVQLSELQMAAMMHDLGKIGVSDEILNKKGQLTEAEMDEIKRHPMLSVKLTKEFLTQPMIDAILLHHERWDGSGYPEGLKGKEIPINARIIAVADVYHAMISDRPWRKKMSQEKVIQFIKKSSGILFDPAVVEIFLNVITKE